MRLTDAARDAVRRRWLQNGRTPPRPPYRFSEVKPLKIKDAVSSQSKRINDVVCIPQMMEMMACFKLNDFDQSKCDKQMAAFQQCYDTYVELRSLKKSQQENTDPVPGQTRLNKSQLNKLLQRYPQTPPIPGRTNN